MNGSRDITEVFLNLVDVRQGSSRLPTSNGAISRTTSPRSMKSASSHAGKSVKAPSPFIVSCKQVYDLLTGLDVMLKRNVLAYLQTSTASSTTGIIPMTEKERQKMDEEAEKSLKSCETTISQLQTKIAAVSKTSQLLDHRSRVLLHLWDIYGDTSAFYFKQKSARLETSIEERMGYTMRHQAILHARRAPRVLHDSPSTNSLNGTHASEIFGKSTPVTNRDSSRGATSSNSAQSDFKRSYDDNISIDDSREFRGAAIEGLDDLDRKVQEQLRRENLALQTSLSTMSDDIRQVEQQMVVISQAQQLIAHNLMQQRDDLAHIHKQTKDASLHITKGNSELEKAAQSGSKFRIFILTFLLIISFLLLLLHKIEN